MNLRNWQVEIGMDEREKPQIDIRMTAKEWLLILSAVLSAVDWGTSDLDEMQPTIKAIQKLERQLPDV